MAYSLTYSYGSTDKAYSVKRGVNITPSDKVVIPATYNDGTNGEHPVTSISNMAFSECTFLTSITIPNSITRIHAGAFYYCTALESVHLPNKITIIDEGTFNYCSSLTSVHIPNSVTSIKTSAFSDCTSLTSVTIPDSITSIEANAFYNCPNLKQLILLPSTPPTLSSGAIPTTIQSIYVQQSSKAAYKAATNWTTFASKIISDDMYLSLAQFNQKNKEYIDKKVESKINATKLYKHEISAYDPDEPYALTLTLLSHMSTAYSNAAELVSANLEDWGLILYAYYDGRYSLGNINATASANGIILSAFFLWSSLSTAANGTLRIHSGLTNFSDVVTDI